MAQDTSSPGSSSPPTSSGGALLVGAALVGVTVAAALLAVRGGPAPPEEVPPSPASVHPAAPAGDAGSSAADHAASPAAPPPPNLAPVDYFPPTGVGAGERRAFPRAGFAVTLPEGCSWVKRQAGAFTHLLEVEADGGPLLSISSTTVFPWMDRAVLRERYALWNDGSVVDIPPVGLRFAFAGERWTTFDDPQPGIVLDGAERWVLIFMDRERLEASDPRLRQALNGFEPLPGTTLRAQLLTRAGLLPDQGGRPAPASLRSRLHRLGQAISAVLTSPPPPVAAALEFAARPDLDTADALLAEAFLLEVQDGLARGLMRGRPGGAGGAGRGR